jgi:ligand-binding SRPBCC domain-containing protein
LLTPPWERVEIIERANNIQVGARVVIKTFIGPFSRLWIAEHTEYIPNRLFVDVQRSGPFAVWHHRHRFEPTARGTTIYTDDVEYALPLGWLGQLVVSRFVRAKLERLFDYRHHVVVESMKKSV